MALDAAAPATHRGREQAPSRALARCLPAPANGAPLRLLLRGLARMPGHAMVACSARTPSPNPLPCLAPWPDPHIGVAETVLVWCGLSIYRLHTRYRYIEMARTSTAKARKEDDAPAIPRRNGQPRVLSRGDLRLLVLALIGEQPRHGYELIQHISGVFMQAYTPSAGTMYPLLASFEQAGWVESEEEDGRRVFRITAAGEFELKVQRTQVRLAQRRAFDRAREITKASLPPPLATALREFKQALVRHHGRWSDGEAEAVAEQLSRASALLNGALGDGPTPVTPTEPD